MSENDKTPSISRRKADHIEIAASGKGDFSDNKTTLLGEVELVHQSLPEMSLDEIDLSTELFGLPLKLPIMISGMTGGTEEASTINRDLARAAEQTGIAFGVGSQRAMADHEVLGPTYEVRDVAPNVVLVGNLGAVQARDLGVQKVTELARSIDANAMAIHLNPGQEMIQQGGDRDFRGQLDIIEALAKEMPIPLVVKETGCGISLEVATKLRNVGVATVDVSGAGGTSWVAVETRRAEPDSEAHQLGTMLWDWGIPTAVSVVAARRTGLEVIASGGLRTGYDAARALALGARAAGFAAPVLRAQQAGGVDEIVRFIERIAHGVAVITLLAGQKRARDLATAPRVLGTTLSRWLHGLGLR